MLRPALSLVAVALLGCPQPLMMSMDAGVVDAGAQLSPTEACEQLAVARCALKKRCYVAFLRDDDTACAQNEQARCLAEYGLLQQSFERELVRISPERVSACVRRMTSSACPPTFPPDYQGSAARPFSDCTFTTGLLIGAVPPGETCVNPQECAAGTVCIKPSGVCRGICSSFPRATEPCAFGCGPGLVCGADGRCAPLKPLDTPCEASTECEPDLICLAGACRPRRKLGDSCAFDPAIPSTCEPGLACDVVPYVRGATGTCIRPRDENERCAFHWSCKPGLVCGLIDWSAFPAQQPTRGFCIPPDEPDFPCEPSRYAVFVGDQCRAGTTCDPTSKRCVVTPKRGEACTPSLNTCAGVGVYCKPSGSGDTGTCSGPAAVNEACAVVIDAETTVSIPCATGWCDRVNSLTCRPPTKPLGTVCAENAECQSGRCAVQPDRTLRCTEAC